MAHQPPGGLPQRTGTCKACLQTGSRPAVLRTEESAADGLFTLKGLETEHPAFPAGGTPADSLEAWETGRVEKNVFYADRRFCRSFRYPELPLSLKTDPGEIRAVMTTDAAGRRRVFLREG